MKIKLDEDEVTQALIHFVVDREVFPAKGEFEVILFNTPEGVIAEISFTPYTNV